MQKQVRIFIVIFILFAIITAVGFSEPINKEMPLVKPTKPEPNLNSDTEIRALWVPRGNFKTPEDVNKIITNAYNCHFNLILFQVRGNGTVFYKSKLEPWAWELTSTAKTTTSSIEAVSFLGKDPGWDPLATAIDTAHKLGLQLHAYMNTFPAWSRTVPPPESVPQLWNTHRDWFMQDSSGKTMWPSGWWDYWYTFIDPGVPAVQDYLASVYTEVVKNYEVDGVHFDYVRYPGEVGDWSFNTVSINRFKETYRTTPAESPSLWNDWKRAQITEVVRKIYTAVNQAKSGKIMVSGAVAGMWDHGYNKYFQDRRTWLKEGIIDMTNPMSYETTFSVFSSEVDEHIKNSAGRFVCPGIGVHKKMTPEMLVQQIELCRKLGANGITLFSYPGLFHHHEPNELAKALLSGPFAQPAKIPKMSWKTETTKP
ncbi:MAG: glycoside hydrolase family 10 protein [bacterium]